MSTTISKASALEVDKYLKIEPKQIGLELTILEEKCPEANTIIFNRDPFPNLETLSQFANNAYDELHKRQYITEDSQNEENWIPPGWKLLATGRNEKNKYYGGVFVNVSQKQLVIAHRGTVKTSKSCFEADITSIVGNSIGIHMLSAITFTHEILTILKSRKEKRYYQISTTGHSLGGWLGHVTTFTAKYLKTDEKDKFFIRDDNFHENFHIHAVTFENPGSKEMLQKLMDDTQMQHKQGWGHKEILNSLDLNSYLSSPNRINGCNKHVGKIFRMHQDFKSHPILGHTLSSHDMENIMDYLKSPSKTKDIEEVFDWPLIKKPDLTLGKWYIKGVLYFAFAETKEYKSKQRYSTGDIVDNICHASVLTPEETNLLIGLNCLKDSNECVSNILKTCCNAGNVEEIFGHLYTQNKITFVENRDRIKFSNAQQLKNTINIVKQLLYYYPTLSKDMMKKIKEIPSAEKQLWKINSKQYLKSLNLPLNYIYKPVQEIVDFLNQHEIKHIIVKTNNPQMEIIRLVNLTKTYNPIALSWQQWRKQHEEIKNLFENELLIIVIDDNNQRLEILKKLKHTVIFVCPFDFSTDISSDREDYEEASEEKLISLEKEIIALNDLDAKSQRNVKELKIKFLNSDVNFFDIIANENETTRQKHMERFVNEQKVENFMDSEDINIEQNMSLKCSKFKILFSKISKSLSKEDFIAFVEKSNDNDKFVITGIEESNFTNYINASFKIEGKIHLQTNCTETNVEYFIRVCKEDNEDSTVYWITFHEEDEPNNRFQIIWEQVYNKKFYIERQLIVRNVMGEMFLNYINKNNKKRSNKAQAQSDEPIIQILGDKDTFKNYLENKTDHKIECEDPLENNKNIIFDEALQGQKLVLELNAEGTELKFVEGLTKLAKTMIDEDSATCIDENNLTNILKNRIVLLADEPGMGKSTFMTTLAEFLHANNNWVVRIELNNFEAINAKCDYFKYLLDIVEHEHELGNELSKAVFLNDMKEALFTNVYLLMDGFDEIRNVDQQKEVIGMIKYLKDNSKINTWITTRTYKQEMLETNLNVFAVKIKEIEENEQTAYLKRYWMICGNLNKNLENEFYKTVQAVLNQAKSIFGIEANSFIGNPLHLKLLADSLQKEVIECTEQKKTVPLNSMLTVYKKFVDNKFVIYFRDKHNERNDLRDFVIEEFLKIFQKIAFKSKFPQEGKDFIGTKKISDRTSEELQRLGMVKINDGEISLLHETFVDYFCAGLIIDWLTSQALYPNVDELLVTKVFLNKECQFVRLFLAELIAESEKNDKGVSRISVEKVWKLKQNMCVTADRETCLHTLTAEGHGRLLEYVLDGIDSNDIFKEIMSIRNATGETALYVAASKEETKITDLLLQQTETRCFRDEAEEIVLATMFRFAEDEKDKVVDKLKNKLVAIDNGFSCVKDVTDALLAMKFWKIIQTFHGTLRKKGGCELREIKNAFLQARSMKQRKYLVLARNSSLKTCMHMAAYNGNVEVIKHLLRAGAELDVYDKYRRTPLHNAVESKSIEAVRFFVEQGLSIAAKDDTGMDAFLKSVKLGLLDIAQYLLTNGADVNAVDVCRINALMQAAKCGHLDLVQFLVEEKRMDVNQQDRFGITALMWAAQRRHKKDDEFKIVRYLTETETIDLNRVDRNGMSAAYYAALKQNQNIVEYLLEKGADVNGADRNGTSVLQRILRWPGKKWEFAEQLIFKYDIDYNIVDHRKTPLQEAVNDKRISVVKHMLSKGACTDYMTEEELVKLEELKNADG